MDGEDQPFGVPVSGCVIVYISEDSVSYINDVWKYYTSSLLC